jgi:hypothetical protein
MDREMMRRTFVGEFGTKVLSAFGLKKETRKNSTGIAFERKSRADWSEEDAAITQLIEEQTPEPKREGNVVVFNKLFSCVNNGERQICDIW